MQKAADNTPTEAPDAVADATTTESIAPPRERRPRFGGIRARMLFWSIASLAIAIVAAVIVVRQVLLAQVAGRIDDALEQEANELRRLADGRDPETGISFNDDVRRIFQVFLERNVPTANETYLTFVGGEVFERTFRAPPYRLDLDPTIVSRLARLSATERGSVDTPVGAVEYLAVPLEAAGAAKGVFVAAIFRDLEIEPVGTATQAAIEVGLITLLIGSLIAWRVAEGVLGPVSAVAASARRISSADLSSRLPVTGHDEIAGLATTFNDMLDKLEDAFETQRRFVDDAGHELRTPITVIGGHLELMGEDPNERRATLALVADELDRMRRIVSDLLTLAKAERTDFLAFEPVDLEVLTREVLAKAEALGRREWTLGGVGRGIVIADRHRLTQAMIQLAQNAVQYTAESEHIEIGSHLHGAEATLWVQDAGEGISSGDLELIFERFARGRRRRAAEGAGLGLSIVRVIAEAHHGRVEVESKPGKGARFALVLPSDQPAGSPGGGP